MDERKAAGGRLKHAIHIARAQADVTSDMALSVKAGVSYDTLMNWYGGRTTPRPFEMRKVATALDISFAELLAAYEDRPVEEPELHEQIAELVPVLRDLVTELRIIRSEQRSPGRSSSPAPSSRRAGAA